jgi:hypothetical protein
MRSLRTVRHGFDDCLLSVAEGRAAARIRSSRRGHAAEAPEKLVIPATAWPRRINRPEQHYLPQQ